MNWAPIAIILTLLALPTAVPASYILFQRLAKDPENYSNLSTLPPRLQNFISRHRIRLHLVLSVLGLLFCGIILWLILPFAGLPEALMIFTALLVLVEALVIGTWAWNQIRRMVKRIPPSQPGTPGEFVRLKQSEYLEEIGKNYFGGSYVRILAWEVIILLVYAAVGTIAFIMFEK